MRFSSIAALLLAAGLTLAPSAHADTLAYPSPDAASFVIDHPSSWEMTPGEEVGDYITLMSEGGTTLMLRTVPGNAEDMKAGTESLVEYVVDEYTKVELSEVTEISQHGISGARISGTATDAEIGEVRVGMAWFKLKDGTLGEIWFVGSDEDAAGMTEASEILGSFRSP